MQFQVPQFIETEDKIVGPFSLRQFAYVGIAGVVSAMFYFAFATWIWMIASLFIFGFALALAFVKVEGRPFVNVLVSAARFYWQPQTYIWQPEHPKVSLPASTVHEEAGQSALEDILAQSVARTKSVFTKPLEKMPAPVAQPKPQPITRETVKVGSALHKSWERVQTGSSLAQKNSDKQFLERKMAERYQIFQRISGERRAAKRVDYR